MASSSAEHLLSVLPGCSPAAWDPRELGGLGCPDASCQPDPSTDRTTYTLAFSKYNPTPGRCAGYMIVLNNYMTMHFASCVSQPCQSQPVAHSVA